MTKEIDISGKRFGRLLAIKRDTSGIKSGLRWWFLCDCNNEVSLQKGGVTSGAQVSCGCYVREQKRMQNLTHGLSKHPLYRTWNGMVQRCTFEHSKDYPYYGGRGVTVCDRWMDVKNFIDDMGEKPERATLDRIDNSKGYEPDNCRWATPIAQGNNKRNNREVFIDGIKFKTLAAAARHFNMPESTLRNRLYSEPTKSAVSRVVAKKNKTHDVGDGRFLTMNEIASEVGIQPSAVRYRIKKGYTKGDLLIKDFSCK